MSRICDVCYMPLKDLQEDGDYVRMFTLNLKSKTKDPIYKPVTLYVYTDNALNRQSIDLCPSCLNNCLMNIVMSGVNDEPTEEEMEEGT